MLTQGADTALLRSHCEFEFLIEAVHRFQISGAKHIQQKGGHLRKIAQDVFEVPLKPEVQYLINPGSVGQPRDGDWRAAFAWFDTETYKLAFHRAPYDLERAQQRILEANLPPRLASRLALGR